MVLRIIWGCVETDGVIYKKGDIIECDESRARKLIEDGYCEQAITYSKPTESIEAPKHKMDTKIKHNNKSFNEKQDDELKEFQNGL